MSESTQPFLAIGFMTGTSMDGIDAAAILTDGGTEIQPLVHLYHPFAHETRLILKAAEQAMRQAQGDEAIASRALPKTIEGYLRITLQLSDEAVSSLLPSLLDAWQLSELSQFSLTHIEKVFTQQHATLYEKIILQVASQYPEMDTRQAVLGFHGQTVFHDPKIKTRQLGSGALLAALTKQTVVNNFRQRDVEQGGQGAPLAPLYHQALVNSGALQKANASHPVMFVNCGGIANITAILGEMPNQVFAFDTGPGNGLVDRYIQTATSGQQSMDKDGALGLQGTVHEAFFSALMSHAIHQPNSDIPYLKRSGAKALDIQDLSLAHESIQQYLQSLTMADVCRTLEAFTAQTIVDSIDLIEWPEAPPSIWVLAGGGWKNPVILSELRDRLQSKLSSYSGVEAALIIEPAEYFGLEGDAIEAQTFAYLAVRRLQNKPTSLPSTTGAEKPTSGGDIHRP